MATLDIPTKARNQREVLLLEEIVADPSLKNANLRRRIQDYLNHQNHYALVAWHHPSASMTRYSFENEGLAVATCKSYKGQKPTPRIVGIKTYEDIN